MDGMTPRKYTHTEGGDWFPWPSDTQPPPIEFYGMRDKRFIVWCAPERDVVVHSLMTPANHRWDCINGWTGKCEWTETKK
jgi:hypothetical protein